MSAEAIRLYNTTLTLLALLALGLAAGLVVYRVARGRDAAATMARPALWLAWMVATVATIGSLVYSEVIHFVPCRLCWFQRILMYPLTIILGVGAWRRDLAVRVYGIPLALIGLAISIWHYLIQVFPALEGEACDPINPCSARYVEVFGFVSIPFMAGAGFTLIAVLLLFYVRPQR
ncbi:MAG: disulfide oxidoreductase [Actinobacteria bacterium]|nr:disulfide oxidoreductase [Actinomycetota bacterium]